MLLSVAHHTRHSQEFISKKTYQEGTNIFILLDFVVLKNI